MCVGLNIREKPRLLIMESNNYIYKRKEVQLTAAMVQFNFFEAYCRSKDTTWRSNREVKKAGRPRRIVLSVHKSCTGRICRSRMRRSRSLVHRLAVCEGHIEIGSSGLGARWISRLEFSMGCSSNSEVRARVSGVTARINKPENSSAVEVIIDAGRVVFVIISAPNGMAISSEIKHIVLV